MRNAWELLLNENNKFSVMKIIITLIHFGADEQFGRVQLVLTKLLASWGSILISVYLQTSQRDCFV